MVGRQGHHEVAHVLGVCVQRCDRGGGVADLARGGEALSSLAQGNPRHTERAAQGVEPLRRRRAGAQVRAEPGERVDRVCPAAEEHLRDRGPQPHHHRVKPGRDRHREQHPNRPPRWGADDQLERRVGPGIQRGGQGQRDRQHSHPVDHLADVDRPRVGQRDRDGEGKRQRQGGHHDGQREGAAGGDPVHSEQQQQGGRDGH